MKFIIHSPGLDIKKHRGHPFNDKSTDNSSIPGLKSYYTISPFLESISHILNQSNTQKMVHSHLLESGLLFNLAKKTALNVLTTFKENDIESATNIRRSVKTSQTEMKTESQFVEQFERDNKILGSLDKDESIQRAKEWAKKFVTTSSPHEFKEIYQLGMIWYYIISSNVS